MSSTFGLWSGPVCSRSYRGHGAPCSCHKLRQRFPFLCAHQHMLTLLPCNIRQEDEFHLDRGIWWCLAPPWLWMCDSSLLAVVQCCIKPPSFVTFSTSQFGLHPPKISSMFFLPYKENKLVKREKWRVTSGERYGCGSKEQLECL